MLPFQGIFLFFNNIKIFVIKYINIIKYIIYIIKYINIIKYKYIIKINFFYNKLYRVFEESDDPNILDTCLEGIVYCIKLLGISNMETEKSTFILFLSK